MEVIRDMEANQIYDIIEESEFSNLLKYGLSTTFFSPSDFEPPVLFNIVVKSVFLSLFGSSQI